MSESLQSWAKWPIAEKLRLLGKAQTEAWRLEANDGQLPPEGDWRVWYARGGRGSGKTRTGAETLAGWILENEPGDWAVVAPTYADARDTCIEGSVVAPGLLQVLGPAVANWNRSIGEMTLANGAKVYCDGADDGALRIQGKNLRGAWCDEIGLWKDWQTAWEVSLAYAIRFEPARIVATGTPKGKAGVVKLLADDDTGDVVMTRLKLEENERNLAPAMITSIRRRHEGTAVGRQELHGEILDDVEGALWTWAMIDEGRVQEAPEFMRAAVAVDPAVTSGPEADETGIIVGGSNGEDGYVTQDLSGRHTPETWARLAVDAYYELGLDCIVYERNQGGDLVAHTIRSVDANVPLRSVWASRGKIARAEPVVGLYEQGRVHHVGSLPGLEAEQTSWEQGKPSPSRVDAVVWLLSHLLLQREAVTVPVAADPRKGLTGDLMSKRW